MSDLEWYVPGERQSNNRYPCPFCGSSASMDVTPEEGDTGVFHCFSCLEAGTGAQFLVKAFDYSIKDALKEFGLEFSPKNLTRDEIHLWKKRKRTRRRRKRRKHELRNRLVEIERAKQYMTDAELRLFRYVSGTRGKLYGVGIDDEGNFQKAEGHHPDICTCELDYVEIQLRGKETGEKSSHLVSPSPYTVMRVRYDAYTQEWLEVKAEELIQRALTRALLEQRSVDELDEDVSS